MVSALPVPYVPKHNGASLSMEDIATLYSLALWIDGSTECECLDSDEIEDEETRHVVSCPRHHSERLRAVLVRSAAGEQREGGTP